MRKLIELGVAIDTAIVAADEYDGGYNFERDRKIRDALMALPTVDAVPVRHGRWKAVKDGEDDYRRICSCCGEDAPYDESEGVYLIYPHCPWCGALMDGKDGEQHGADIR